MLCTRRAQVEKRKKKLLTIDYSVVLSILLPIYPQPTHDDVDKHAPLRRYIQTMQRQDAIFFLRLLLFNIQQPMPKRHTHKQCQNVQYKQEQMSIHCFRCTRSACFFIVGNNALGCTMRSAYFDNYYFFFLHDTPKLQKKNRIVNEIEWRCTSDIL